MIVHLLQRHRGEGAQSSAALALQQQLLRTRDTTTGVQPFLQVPDVGVDQHAVHLRVNRLYQHLEAVEGAGLGELDLLAEPLDLLRQKHFILSRNFTFFSFLFCFYSRRDHTEASLLKNTLVHF